MLEDAGGRLLGALPAYGKSHSQGEYVFTVRKGLVKLVRYQSDGSQRIIRLIGPGDIAGQQPIAGIVGIDPGIAARRHGRFEMILQIGRAHV